MSLKPLEIDRLIDGSDSDNDLGDSGSEICEISAINDVVWKLRISLCLHGRAKRYLMW